MPARKGDDMIFWADEAQMEADLVAVLEVEGGPLHEDEIIRRAELRAIERALVEAVRAGDISGRLVNGEWVFRKKLTRAELTTQVIELRQQGLRLVDIAKELWIDPATASQYLFEAKRMDLQHATPRQLEQWRREAAHL